MSDFLDTPACVILSFAILVSAIAWPLAWCSSRNTAAAIAAGLVEKPNGNNTYWTKP